MKTEEAAMMTRLGLSCRHIRRIASRDDRLAFDLGDGRLRVVARILDEWLESGRWWEGEQEAAFQRLLLSEGAIAEVMRDRDGEWWLVRLLD